VRHSAPPFAPHPQHRKIKQIASQKNPPKKKLGEDRIRPSVYSPAQPFRSTTPLPQPRKIKQVAVAEKAAWWGAGC